VVKTHAAGSPRIDADARPVMSPRRTTAKEAVAVETSEEATALAQKAVAAADAAAKERAPDKLPPTPLISTLAGKTLRAFIDAMQVRAVPPGAVVIDVGQPATALYWMARGRAEVTRDGKLLGELAPGALFGEIALVSGSTRTATVTTTSDTWLLEVPTAAVEAAAAKEAKLAEVLAHHARTRLLANLMRTSEVFTALPADDRAALLPRFEPMLVAAGDEFISEGDDNEHLWLLVSGRCEVRNNDKVIATLGPGAVLGEISLLARKPATADVVAIEPSSLLALPRKEFETIAANHPQVLSEVYKLVVAREEANRALEHDAADLVV
jgi:CRP-like cAMP-binding protein